jgi:predicted ester cyclase
LAFLHILTIGELKQSRENDLMSEDDNNRLIRRYIEEVINTGDVERLPEFIGPYYVEIYNNVKYESGLEGAKQHILGGCETYSGLHLTIEKQIAEGDWVVTQVTARGTHSGTWMGIKPTGKDVEFTCVNVDKVVNGRIVEHGGAANMLEPLLAVGAIRVVGSED